MSDLAISAPQLQCFSVISNPPRLVPGTAERDWMDFTNQRFAYRCTPLTMANTTGWELLNPTGFWASWTGLNGKDEVILRPDDPRAPMHHVSLGFGHGIITFHPGYLFRTAPGWMTWARGAPNRLKHGIQALDGLVETSWVPFTFTMNWKFTEPGTVYFAKDEPFCFITLVPSLPIESVQPVIRPLADDPKLEREYNIWLSERTKFNIGLAQGDPITLEQKWQKNYLIGKSPSGRTVADQDHRIKRSLKPPASADKLERSEIAEMPAQVTPALEREKPVPAIVMRQAFPSFQSAFGMPPHEPTQLPKIAEPSHARLEKPAKPPRSKKAPSGNGSKTGRTGKAPRSKK
ncbi:DUF6065 family protein [Labrys sp. La1]|uniref:DUF6065 family protein n=1 Tax=Labrys sp. La1 TaxID=3404917 RepID=UPI003EC02C37